MRNQLKRKRDEIFSFVIDRSVKTTNNRGVRAKRPIVIYRKVTNGPRSDTGIKDFTRYTVFPNRIGKKKTSVQGYVGIISGD